MFRMRKKDMRLPAEEHFKKQAAKTNTRSVIRKHKK